MRGYGPETYLEEGFDDHARVAAGDVLIRIEAREVKNSRYGGGSAGGSAAVSDALAPPSAAGRRRRSRVVCAAAATAAALAGASAAALALGGAGRHYRTSAAPEGENNDNSTSSSRSTPTTASEESGAVGDGETNPDLSRFSVPVLCSRDALGTVAGYVACESACLSTPRRCLDGSGRVRGAWAGCEVYDACGNLRSVVDDQEDGGEVVYSGEGRGEGVSEGNSYEDDDDEYDSSDDDDEDEEEDELEAAEVARRCDPANLRTDAGVDECELFCRAGRCCFQSDEAARSTWLHAEEADLACDQDDDDDDDDESDDNRWCDIYAPCSVLADHVEGGPMDGRTESVIGATCGGGESDKACSAACAVAACCFAGDDGGPTDSCELDCQVYTACEAAFATDLAHANVADVDLIEPPRPGEAGFVGTNQENPDAIIAELTGTVPGPFDDERAKSSTPPLSGQQQQQPQPRPQHGGDAPGTYGLKGELHGFAPSVCAPNLATALGRCRNPDMPICDHPAVPSNGPCHVRCDDVTGFGEGACDAKAGDVCVKFVRGCLCPVPPCDGGSPNEDLGESLEISVPPEDLTPEAEDADPEDYAPPAVFDDTGEHMAFETSTEGLDHKAGMEHPDVEEKDIAREHPTAEEDNDDGAQQQQQQPPSDSEEEDNQEVDGRDIAKTHHQRLESQSDNEGWAPSVCAPDMATASYRCSHPDLPACDHPAAPSNEPCHMRCDDMTGFGEDACDEERGESCIAFVRGCRCPEPPCEDERR